MSFLPWSLAVTLTQSPSFLNLFLAMGLTEPAVSHAVKGFDKSYFDGETQVTFEGNNVYVETSCYPCPVFVRGNLSEDNLLAVTGSHWHKAGQFEVLDLQEDSGGWTFIKA